MGGRGLVASLLLVGAATACTPDVRDDVDDDAVWRTSAEPIYTGGFVWAVGSTVHLADGTTIDTGATVRALLVGGDGVFFVPFDPEDDDGRFVGADLFFTAPDGDAVDTGLDVDDEGVAVSPDGTHLAVLATDYDTGGAEMRLYDLTSGDGVTTDDGFDTDRTDPVHDLNESEVAILVITDAEVYARTTGGDWAYDLDSGDARELGEDEVVPERGADPLQSPAGGWRIEQRDGLRAVLVPDAGEDVVPDAPAERWTLSRWIDEGTVLGIAVDGPGDGDTVGPDDVLSLMTCQVPSGACVTVPGTAGERVVVPLRPGAGGGFDLRPPDEP
ncbi:hypothetical protein EUA06_12695 [Nocardioides glacieisoli]|uniref:WD40 repeat domain-containing protein n=1 Tax=Nocardioides glacieisoli TaxID=1168730 RepID=A0A4Q2RP46_9ACTN|nr:hypothetical protein [Nocardioides glacieisoli]RYB90236.1 hypothetical protein EUA06_12695 [Nocardioides glacieisoli]